MVVKYKSVAHWPIGTLGGMKEKTTDTHRTREAAEAVCERLESDGFGGLGEVSPDLLR